MLTKRRLFGLANYFLLVLYVYLLLFALEFIVVENSHNDVTSFLPFSLSLLIVILNSLFSIYVFHKYLPNKLLSRQTQILYSISAILYVLALVTILMYILPAMINDLKENSIEGDFYISLAVLLINMSLGLFVLFYQRSIIRNNKQPKN